MRGPMHLKSFEQTGNRVFFPIWILYRIPVLATAVQAELKGGPPKPSEENNKEALKEEVRRMFY